MKKRVQNKIHKRAGLRIEEISFGKQIKREIDEDIEEVEKEINQAERWIIARRKFFIKLGWIVLMIVVVLIINAIVN
jgi:hypothetical protein